MPRIRNWKVVLSSPPPLQMPIQVLDRYLRGGRIGTNQNPLWYDMMGGALSIKAGKVMPSPTENWNFDPCRKIRLTLAFQKSWVRSWSIFPAGVYL